MKRENNYDFLRIIAAFAVVLIHVNAVFLETRYNSQQNALSITYIVEHLLNSALRFCVPCFFMLSGAFILNNNKNINCTYFYKKSFSKIVPSYIFIRMFWIVLKFAQNLGALGAIDSLKNTLTHFPYGTWFVPLLLGLYLLTPLLIRIKSLYARNNWKTIIFIFLLWITFSQRMSFASYPYSLNAVIPFLGYYLLGDILYNEKKLNRKQLVFSTITSIVMVVASVMYNMYIDDYYLFNPYSSYFSPFTLVFSVVMFWIFASLDIRTNMHWLADKTYYIYLFHGVVLSVFLKITAETKVFEIVKIFILGILTFILSLLGAMIYQKIIKAIKNKFMPKYNSMAETS